MEYKIQQEILTMKLNHELTEIQSNFEFEKQILYQQHELQQQQYESQVKAQNVQALQSIQSDFKVKKSFIIRNFT